jgi:hypothetical protein
VHDLQLLLAAKHGIQEVNLQLITAVAAAVAAAG